MTAREQFAHNPDINKQLHEIIYAFPEPSRSRMRKKIIEARDALRRHRTDDTDSAALHTFREFLPAYQLLKMGIELEYSRKVDGLTPDWIGENVLMEVFTCEFVKSDWFKRIIDNITSKIDRYRAVVERRHLPMVVAVHPVFELGLDDGDFDNLSEAIPSLDPTLSGVILFQELGVVTSWFPRTQPYRFLYCPHPSAIRPFPLSAE